MCSKNKGEESIQTYITEPEFLKQLQFTHYVTHPKYASRYIPLSTREPQLLTLNF